MSKPQKKKQELLQYSQRAVEIGLLSHSELATLVKYLQTDLGDLFNAINTIKGKELIKQLRGYKREYHKRLYIENSYDRELQTGIFYIYDKVEEFIEEKISETVERINENDKKKKKDSKLTHYHSLLTLKFLVPNSVSKEKLISLLYLLRGKEVNNEVKNTTEFSQLKKILGKDYASQKKFKKYAGEVKEIFNECGLFSNVKRIENEIEALKEIED